MLRLTAHGRNIHISVEEHDTPLYWSCAILAQRIYRDNYSARISPRPARFVACHRDDGKLVACAGLTARRDEKDRLFSEVYLDQPLEALIGDRFGRSLPVQAIAEVNALATIEPAVGQELVRVIPPLAWFLGYQGLLCTATRRLQQIFVRQHLPFEVLAIADKARIPPTPGVDWGTYYDTTPATGLIRLDRIGGLFDAHCGRYSFASQLGSPDSWPAPAPVVRAAA